MLKKLWLLPLLLWAILPAAQAADYAARDTENHLIIAFKPGTTTAAARKIAVNQGLKVLDETPNSNPNIGMLFLLTEVKAGRFQEVSDALKSNPTVKDVGGDIWIEKWIESHPASFQETPLNPAEFNSLLKDLPKPGGRGRVSTRKSDEELQWGVKKVNAPAAWPENQGDGVKVAVVDTGIDKKHPDLKVVNGYNAIDKKTSWADDHAHGTHVAGIIAAAMNGRHVVGVAPKASLFAVKVLTKEGGGNLFAILDGIMWCAQNGMQVVNMSLGAPQEMPMLQYALQAANKAGVTIIAAAGNGDGKGGSSPVNYPGAYPEAIAVSALAQQADQITKWSSRGPQVAFIAPGDKVPSTVPLWHDKSGVKAYSGTSMATPHVAGLAALAISKGANGPQAVLDALSAAAHSLGLDVEEEGFGLIDAGLLK